MKATNWDAIVTSAPANKDAALARDGRNRVEGLRYTYNGVRSDVPLPTRRTPASMTDLTGRRAGELTVQGLYAPPSAGKNARPVWVVRCSCGWYETRRGEALAREDIPRDCSHCDYTRKLRQQGRSSVSLAEKAKRRAQSEASRAQEKNHIHTQQPLPLRALPPNPGLTDFTGLKIGKITVLGLFANPGGLWVVQCECGIYEVRRGAALKQTRPVAADDCYRCEACNRAARYGDRARPVPHHRP